MKKAGKKANILHIVDTLRVGGAERAVADIVSRLDTKKYNVSVCCAAGGGHFAELLGGKRVYVLGKRKGIDMGLVLKIRGIIKKEKALIVHTHLPSGHFYGRIAAILSGAKAVVSTYHGMSRLSKQHFFARRLQSFFTDRIIAVSKATKEYYMKNEKLPEKKLSVIYNGIDASIYKTAGKSKARKALGLGNDDFAVGYFGRLEKIKNIPCLLKAARAVGSNVRNSKFIIAGSGSMEKELRTQARRLGLQNAVFLGERSDIPEIIPAMDAVVLPSLSEGCSISILEAMASSKPVIATKVGGNPEIIDDCRTGILVQPDDPAVLATAIMMLAGNSKAGELMGKSARKDVASRFSIEGTVRKYEEIYDSLIRKNAGKPGK